MSGEDGAGDAATACGELVGDGADLQLMLFFRKVGSGSERRCGGDCRSSGGRDGRRAFCGFGDGGGGCSSGFGGGFLFGFFNVLGAEPEVHAHEDEAEGDGGPGFLIH